MPIMNGFDSCFKIKKSYNEEFQNLFQIVLREGIDESEKRASRRTPIVIAVSGHLTSEDIEHCKEMGFDDFSMEYIHNLILL
jgi:CheY-like chemotaxis protein